MFDAAALAAVVATMEPEDRPQSYLVETTGEAIADVIIALHRDRVGVPEALAQALSTMLVIYAANTTGEEREARDTSPRIEPSP
jgi:hypothetical protein